EERVLIGMLIQPMCLLHRLHELAKERSATVRHLVGAATAKIVQPARLPLQQKNYFFAFCTLNSHRYPSGSRNHRPMRGAPGASGPISSPGSSTLTLCFLRWPRAFRSAVIFGK